MKLRDNKKYRNFRLWKQKENARDKKEFEIGNLIGCKDKNNLEICNGDKVIVYCSAGRVNNCIVLFCPFFNNFVALREKSYLSDRDKFDSRLYDKYDYIFDGKQRRVMNVEVV